jgi:hypothetical protein
MFIASKSAQELRRQAAQLIQQAKRLNQAADLLSSFGKPGSRRVLSVAARKRIAQAQKIRWAKWKAKKAA